MDRKYYLCAVGIGPGSKEEMTFRAYAALEAADLIVGYKTYIDLLKPLFPVKEFYSTGMRGEVERCREAIRLALEGKRVAVISSGDAGVFAMATLLLELAQEEPELAIEVIPGVTAATSGAALLGAPLAHDFACISLSDQLTPWALIERRLRAVSEADLCLALYNPASKERPDSLRKAAAIMSEFKAPETVCGYTQKIGRSGQEIGYLTLAELADFPADMQTTIFVGNCETRILAGRMVTPRGYRR
ncbi:MAG: precorrin-3B C(17)-methyltransferase [Eubacteriales bacterium]|nr:precorrin-3B C(17)-methyltransferase [Eubacteriales bacterium]